jgi:glyoxylase-like metal-dependent hydrolase (beta-lactamase superfamily II)/ADP-ribose pyrophosphatase YjhB (NUDIX family)
MSTQQAAAVVVRVPDGRVLVGVRTAAARSWPGTIAFPGGGTEDDLDMLLPLVTSTMGERMLRATALRELGEETGLWLLARRDGTTDAAAHAHAVAALRAGGAIDEVLNETGLALDDRRLLPMAQWRTPNDSFHVRQFLLPLDDVMDVMDTDELDDVRFADPRALMAAWRDGAIYFTPPSRHILSHLAEHHELAPRDLAKALAREPTWTERARLDLVAGMCLLPARTPTLPPATHTNALLLGAGDLPLLVDPATPYPDEQEFFDRALDVALDGRALGGIVMTHHHADHMGDVERLRSKHGVPVYAHPLTRDRVSIVVDKLLHDGDVLTLPGTPSLSLHVLHTPGHAPGHVCLWEPRMRVLVAGDMVASTGSILIDPPDGHMATYLAQLERLANLKPRALFPSHGPLIVDGEARLREQLAHRQKREVGVQAALTSSPQSLSEIVHTVYGADTHPMMLPFAERSVAAIVELLVERGVAHVDTAGRVHRA